MSYQNLHEVGENSFSFHVPTGLDSLPLENYIVEINTKGTLLTYKAFVPISSRYPEKIQVTSWESIAPYPHLSIYNNIKHTRNITLYNFPSINSFAEIHSFDKRELTKAFIKFTSWYLFSKISEVNRLMLITEDDQHEDSETHIVSSLKSLSWSKEGTYRKHHINENGLFVNCDIYSLLKTDYPGASFLS